MILGIDLDGCLANFNQRYGDLLARVAGVDLRPTGWAGNPDWPSEWNWDSDSCCYDPRVIRTVWRDLIIDSTNFWQGLEPLPRTRQTLKQLNKLGKKGHDVYFLTHRAGKKAKLQTEAWLYEHGVDFPSVLLSGEKAPIIRSLGVDVFIDDKIENVLSVLNETRARVYLVDAGYNRQDRDPKLRIVQSVEDALKMEELW